jgi:hypothetical protein
MPPIAIACLAGIIIFCVLLLVLRAVACRQKDTRTSVPGINRRKEHRIPVTSEFDLFWQDVDASHKSARARGIEISEHGASMRSTKPIVCNAVVQVRGRQIQFEGKAVVKRCERKGLSYIIGLELEGRKGLIV